MVSSEARGSSLSVLSSNAIVRRTIRPPRETLSEPV